MSVFFFCHNIEACNLPREVAAKRSNQQNDSFAQSYLSLSLFFFICSLTLRYFYCTYSSLSLSELFARETRCNSTWRQRDCHLRESIPLPDWISSFALPTAIGRTEATRQSYNDAGKSNIRGAHVSRCSFLRVMNPISRVSATDRKSPDP